MGFHAYIKPTDYVTCDHTARQGIYGDDNLTASAVRLKLGYLGGPLEDAFGRADSTASLPGTTVEVGSVVAGGVQLYKWNLFPRGQWGVTSGRAYNSNGSANAVCWIDNANNGMTNVGGDRTDADMTVEVSATVRAGLARVQSDNNFLVCILDIAAGKVKVIDIQGTFDNATLFTGTTTITSGTTYTLRMVNVGSSYSVYLNGVLEGTFSESTYSSLAVKPGIHAHNDSAARFDNLRVAKASNPVASTYTLRNYAGNVIKTGSITNEYIDLPDADLTVDGVAGHKYGWYRLYLTGADHADGQWGTAYGDCTFLRIPPYTGFPANGGISTANHVSGTDEISRGVMAMGINRYAIEDAGTAAATSIAALTPAVTRMKEWWIDNADAARPRKTLIAFPNGTSGNEATVTSIVNGLKTWVNAWSTLNEPNYFYGNVAANFIPELAAFNTAVKAADPTATVLAPGMVSFGQYGANSAGIQYFKDFLAAGGDAHCDAYDVHPYNCYNGDLQAMRFTIGGLLDEIALNGDPSKVIYQTEQGYGHIFAGQYTPPWAARWTALMVFCQEVLTMGKMRYENSFYWYDTTIGFDNFPFYWLTPSGVGPQPGPIRTQAAEVRGKTITSELDFGNTGKQMYCGGVWTDGLTGNKVIGVIAGSVGLNDIRFAVTGSSTFTRVDAWGNQTTLTASGGYVTFPVSELGCWLRVPAGTTAALVPADWSWGTNACIGGTPNTAATPPASGTTYVNLAMMNNDDYESWYQSGGEVAHVNPLNNPFVQFEQVYPMQAWVTFSSRPLNRFVVVCTPPWHDFGTMLDFDLQTYDGSTWTTRQTWNNTGSYTWLQFTGTDRCTSEFFWQDQWIFEHKAVSPITCQGVRVNVRTNSHGGFPNLAIQQANDNGQGGWGYRLYLREIQAFNVTTTAPATAQAHVRRWRRG